MEDCPVGDEKAGVADLELPKDTAIKINVQWPSNGKKIFFRARHYEIGNPPSMLAASVSSWSNRPAILLSP